MTKLPALKELTTDQIAHLKIAHQRRVTAMTSTARLDQSAAGKAIETLYDCAGKPAPAHVVFAQSPSEAMWICTHLAERDGFADAHLSDVVRADLAPIKKGDMGNYKLVTALGTKMYDKIDKLYIKARISGDVHTQVHEGLKFTEGDYLVQKTSPKSAVSPIRAALAERRGVASFKIPATDPAMLAMDCDLLAAPNLAGLVAKFAYFHDTHGAFEEGRGLFEVARHCGSVWAFKNVAIVSERPVEILYDLYHPEPWTVRSPSVVFADGTKI